MKFTATATRTFLLSAILFGGLALNRMPAYSQDFGDLIDAVKNKEDKKTDTDEDKNTDKKGKKYADVLKGARTEKGFITLHLLDGKLYLEIPKTLLGKPLLFSGRVAGISNNKDVIAGQMPSSPLIVSWSKDDTKLYLHEVSTSILTDPESSIATRVKDNNLDPILSAFKIETWKPDSSAMVINATNLFLSNDEPMSPFLPESIFDSFLGIKKLSGSFKKDLSSITDISAFPTNFNVTLRAVYTVNKGPFTAIINGSMLLLPDDIMRPRLADDRIGYFLDGSTRVTTKKMTMDKVYYINRWRLEPKPEDLEAYKRGELVVPKKQIVYYIDNAFPKEWYPFLKEGIEDWQTAFEEIGFKDAIIAKPYPDDPSFNPQDARYSCLVYSSSRQANAMGPSWTDPRSGEILQASVYFYHNVLQLLHSWRFVQTAAADPSARSLNYDLTVLGPMLRYLVAHEVGHTLGLMHNMGASSAYSVRQLRSPKFTSEWGTTPSIMDYARYNYVAQPGDGVTNFLPPRLGLYDIYAIKWGYKPIFEAETPQDELPILRSWIDEHAGDLRYAYGPQQILESKDPTAQTEDLSNDAVAASALGIKNLKLTVENLFKWTGEKGEDYTNQERLLSEIRGQFRQYMGHVSTNIGGFRRNLNVQGDGQTKFSPVPRDKQRESLFFVLKETLDFPYWMATKEVTEKLGKTVTNYSDDMISTMGLLVNNSTLGKLATDASLQEDRGNIYTQEMYLNDLSGFVWQNTGALTPVEKNMQYGFVNALLDCLEVRAGVKGKDKFSTPKIEAKGYLWNALGYARQVIDARMTSGIDSGHYTALHFMIEEALKD